MGDPSIQPQKITMLTPKKVIRDCCDTSSAPFLILLLRYSWMLCLKQMSI